MAATKNGKGEGRPQKKPTPPPGSQIYVFYRFLQLGLFQMSWNCALWAGRFITPHAYIPTENKIRPTMGPQNWRNWGQIAVLGSLLLKKGPIPGQGVSWPWVQAFCPMFRFLPPYLESENLKNHYIRVKSDILCVFFGFFSFLVSPIEL